jgi:UDP-glucose 4-epimerase
MLESGLFRSKKVLITGGCGFIGSNLAMRLVNEGAKITLVDSLLPQYGGTLHNIASIRSRIHLNISDVRDENSLKFLVKNQDYLFNLAGQNSHLDSMRDPHTDLDINARAQLSILESCRLYNPEVKIVFSSTRQVYGRPHHLPVDEDHPTSPVDVNGIHKVAGESYHTLYNSVYGVRVVVLRLTNTYGPRMRVKDARQTFLGIWIQSVLNGEPIRVFGDGSQLRDFNYVDDVVDALILSAIDDRANGEVFNLGSDTPTSLGRVAELLVSIAHQGSIEHVEFPRDRKVIDIGDYYSDFSKIRSALGWRPRVSLEEGIRRTLDFYRAHGRHYWHEDLLKHTSSLDIGHE